MRGAVEDNRSYFEHIYQYAPVGVALIAPGGTWLRANPALLGLLGCEAEEELIGRNIMEYFHDRDHEVVRMATSALLAGREKLQELEVKLLRKDGKFADVMFNISAGSDDQGEPGYLVGTLIDITAKKREERELRQTEELYRFISENAQEIIYGTDKNGVWTYCSQSASGILGYPPEELLGSDNEEMYHPDDLKRLKAEAEKNGCKKSETVRFRFRHQKGHYLWFETTVKQVHSGSAMQLLCIGRDISERKRSEDVLNEAERIAAIGSWIWDFTDRRLVVTDQVYRICRMNKGDLDLTRFNFLDYLGEEYRVTFKEAFRKAMTGQPFHFEYRYVHKDQSVQYLHIRGNVVFDKDGTPLRINGTIQDITERKEVELKLQETVERYTSLKKYNHDAVISLDLKGKIIHGNRMAEKLTGFTIKELEGMSLSRLIGSVNLRKILKESLTDSSIDNNIDSIRHKDGHLVEVMTTIAPIIINNENVGFYVIAKDITEQKKLLIAKEAAESTNRAKSAFLAMMSHEIRTPMNGVIGMTDLLMESTDLNEEQQEYVEIIRKSGESLLNIINDILDFSKIESGKTTIVQEPFHLRGLIAETMDLLTPRAMEKDLMMNLSISDSIPETVIGDSERLKQVLVNLIGNSLKFTFSGGVTLEAGFKQSCGKTMEIEFSVKDTGIGIPKDKIGQLFQPFYQLDHFMTRKHEGTGLGLAISKKLVELMGGQIWVESHQGPGVTFHFTVIMDSAETTFAQEVSEEVQLSGGKRRLNILVGEDNETNKLVIRKMLEKQGHRVVVASNGQEIIEKLQYEKFELIFMDIQMPELNGIEAVRIIRRTFPADQIPVIVAVTANALKGDRELCLAAGMDEYLTKPIKNRDLAEVIDRFFGVEKAIADSRV